ncbi:copper resistance protein CopC [Actinomycetales bacterium SN12]|nr:copper resistance protein CopC [Actinomycetales bacterium SN12]
MFRIRTTLAAVAVATIAALAVAAPASAHDEIVSSTPAADAQLTDAPSEVVLTFSNTLLSLDENSGTAMTVVDDSGEDWVAGPPAVAADTVTVPLADGMPGGAYTVTWQVVSSDGHPTSGEYSFSLTAAEESAAPSATPTETAAAEPTDQPSDAAQPAEQSDSMPWPLLIGLGVVLLVAIVTAIVIVVRRRR